MSEESELTELMQRDPKVVEQMFRDDPDLRRRIQEKDDTLSSGEKVSAGGFAKYYELQYQRKLPYLFVPVAEEFSWAFHNRKGIALEGWRGIGKSTFFAAWCPYVQGVNPVGSTALIRINDAKAKEMGKVISDIIMTNLGWKQMFPHVLPDTRASWSVENGFEVLDTRVTGEPGSKDFEKNYAKWRMLCLANHLSEKSLVCNGVESGSNIGLHPTNGEWFDDLHDEQNTKSLAELKKVTDIVEANFVGTWFSAGGSPTLGAFYTPWSDNPPDAYQKMLGTGLFKKVSIPIYKEDPEGEEIPATTSEGKPIDPEYAGKKVKLTWKEAFDAQRVADIIYAAKTRFGQMYLLDVNKSRPKNMRYQSFPHTDIKWNEWRMTLGVDPVTWVKGISSGEGVSHFAAYQLLKTPYNTLVIAGGKLERCDALEGQRYIAETQRTFTRTYENASIERNGGGAIFISMLASNKGVKYHGHDVSELGTGAKKKRIYDFLQPLFAIGALLVSDEITPELDAVREGLDVYPNYAEDSYIADLFDAIAIGVLDVPEIWTRIVNNVIPDGSIWNMQKKQADPYAMLLEGRR